MKKNLTSKLTTYSQLAKSLRKPLPLAAPLALGGAFLAALPMADAQQVDCQPPINGGNTITVNANASFHFDLDGNGTTADDAFFRVNNVGGLFFYNLANAGNPIALRTDGAGSQNYGRLVNLTTNAVITAGQAFGVGYSNYIGIAVDHPTYGLRGAFAPPNNSGTIGLKMAGNRLGFIQIEIISVGPPGSPVQFRILNYGVQTAAQAGMSSSINAITCGPLPVELTTFQAVAEKEAIRLVWATATEKDNAGFQVERSENGTAFKKIGFIEGAGTTATSRTYRFEDRTVRTGQPYFYRLKQIDNSGAFQYSDMVSATLSSEKLALDQIFPNPVPSNGAVQLHLHLPQASDVVLTVFDLRGIAVRTERHDLAAGSQSLQLQVQALPAGTYFVKAEANGGSVYQKLVVGQ